MPTSFTQMFEISRSGLMLRMFDLDVVSHNLANINTNGYKKERTNFQELLNQIYMQSDGVALTEDLSTRNGMNGIQISSTQMLMAQGDLKNTGRSLDVAINGEGFFGVYLPDGSVAYTRDGGLQLDAENQIVTTSGYKLVWDGTLPEITEEIEVDQSGQVSIVVDGSREIMGTIPLFRFVNASGLSSRGDNLYLASPASGEAEQGVASTGGMGMMVNRTLENTNVNMSEEITRMVSLQRSFELSIRSLQQSDTMLAQAIQMRQM